MFDPAPAATAPNWARQPDGFARVAYTPGRMAWRKRGIRTSGDTLSQAKSARRRTCPNASVPIPRPRRFPDRDAQFGRVHIDETIAAVVFGPQSHPCRTDGVTNRCDCDYAIVAQSTPVLDISRQLCLFDNGAVRWSRPPSGANTAQYRMSRKRDSSLGSTRRNLISVRRLRAISSRPAVVGPGQSNRFVSGGERGSDRRGRRTERSHSAGPVIGLTLPRPGDREEVLQTSSPFERPHMQPSSNQILTNS
jgi:hypothetical protein